MKEMPKIIKLAFFINELNYSFFIIMSEEVLGRGCNIKCYDKIKITHFESGLRLHSNNFECKSGSYNQAVSCHKVRDDTDWYLSS